MSESIGRSYLLVFINPVEGIDMQPVTHFDLASSMVIEFIRDLLMEV